jgi:hypothetical protein
VSTSPPPEFEALFQDVSNWVAGATGGRVRGVRRLEPGEHVFREDARVYFIRCSRWSPTRSEFAIAVKAGFTAPMLGKMLVSTT